MRLSSGALLVVLLATLSSSACAGFGDEAWVTKYAAERLACDKKEVVVTPIESNYYAVSGCGRSDEVMNVCIATSCKLNTLSDLSTRGSFDLGCEKDQLQIEKLDRDTMGVSGCGQRATYKATLEGWVMNASTTVDGTSKSPASDGSSEPSAPSE